MRWIPPASTDGALCGHHGPTALSVGPYVDASGQAFIRALALGSEVAARLQSLLGHYGTRSQFTASVGGALGAAVVAGLLLGLDAGQMEDALGLAASGACGLSSHHREPLHQIKSLNHGRAAEAGVLSALLAQEGFHGPTEVLTCEHGFFDAFLGLPGVGHEVVDGLGEPYLMRQIAYKRYPVGGPDQTPLYAFLHLIKLHELAAEDIEQIEVSVSRSAFHTVMTNHHPSVHRRPSSRWPRCMARSPSSTFMTPAIGKTRGCRPSGPELECSFSHDQNRPAWGSGWTWA